MLLLTGKTSCGKTLLSRRLIVGFSPAWHDVALMRIGQQELRHCVAGIQQLNQLMAVMRIRPLHGRGADVVYYGTHEAATEWTGLGLGKSYDE